MKKMKKLKGMLAMLLVLVMMAQNVQVLTAGTTTDELDARTEGEVTQDDPPSDQIEIRVDGDQYNSENNGQNDDQNPDSSGDQNQGDPTVTDGSNIVTNNTGSDSAVANNLSSNITQQIYQQEIDGAVYNFVQLTAAVTNNDVEHDAAGVDVKILLPQQLSYVTNNETGGMAGFNSSAEAVGYGYSMEDVPQDVQAAYGAVMMWSGQTIGAGQTASYTVSTQLADGITDVSGINPAWYVGGFACSGSWQNTELLIPAEEPEDPAPTEEPGDSAPTEEPGDSAPTEEPGDSAPTEEPGDSDPAEEPEDSAPTEEPGDSAPAEEPGDSAPTEEPEDSAPTEEPEDSVLTGEPLGNNLLGAEPEKKGEDEENTSKVMTGFDEDVANYSPSDSFLTSPPAGALKIIDENGNPVENYDPNTDTVSGKKFNLSLNFAESESFQMDNTPNFVYELPAALKISSDISARALGWKAETPEITKTTYGVPGYYKVDAATNSLYIQMNPDFVKDHPSVSADVEIWGEFHRTSGESTDITIGDTGFHLKFDSNPLEASKGVSAYDKENGGFTFTIDVISYGTPTNVNVTDTLGSNLELVPGSVKILSGGQVLAEDISADTNARPYVTSPDASNTFVIALADEWLAAQTGSSKKIQIQYQAKIKNMVPKDGSVIGLDNTAVIQEEGAADFRKVTANGSYSVEWIRKAAGVLQEDGTIKWSLHVNEGAKADTTGLTITDTLKGSGQQYDISRPITITRKGDTVPKTVLWTDPDLEHDYNAAGEEYWSYKIPEEYAGNYEYQFTYYTLVKPGMTGTEYGNVGSVSKGDDSVSTGIIYGPGTGTGDGVVSKKYEEKLTIDGTDYAKWTATIHVPATGLTKVVFTDQLTGAHKFPQPLTQGAAAPDIQCTGYNGALNITRDTDTKMTILFGSGTAEGSELPANAAQTAYDVVITYYTELTSTEGQIENTASVTSEQRNGFTEEKEELKEYTFGKLGSIHGDDSKLLDWTLILSSNLELDMFNPLVISDELSGAHTYVQGSAHLYRWNSTADINAGTPTDYTRALSVSTKGNSLLEFQVSYPLESKYAWTINYQTTVGNGTSDTEFRNTASFFQNNKKLGDASASVDTSATYVTKTLNGKPNVGNSYRAKFQVEINGSSLEIKDNQSYTYRVKDYSDTSVNIQEGSIAVVDKDAPEAKVTFGYTYKKGVIDEDGKAVNLLEITIPSVGKHTYLLSYEALIIPDNNNKPDASGNLTYHNWAEFEAHTSGSTNTVEIKADSSGTGGAENKYVSVLKRERGNNQPLKNAGFTLSHYQNGSWTVISSEAKTGADGKAWFGTSTEKIECTPLWGNKVLKPGDVYKFEETTVPFGYLKANDLIFIYGEKKDANADLYAELREAGNTLTVVVNTAEIPFDDECITEVQVEKIWEEGDNTHPDTVTVTLKAKASVDGSPIAFADLASSGLLPAGFTAEKVLSDNTTWKAAWANLPKYDNSTPVREITYTVEEIVPEGYQAAVADITTDTDRTNHLVKYKINNYKIQENTRLKVVKEWDDLNNADQARPDSIKVQLYRTEEGGAEEKVTDFTYSYNVVKNGTVQSKKAEIIGEVELNSSNNWTFEWPVLPKKTDDGKAITWTVKELTSEDGGNTYTPVPLGGSVTGKENKTYKLTKIDNSKEGTTIFTNSYEWEKTNVPVKKIWDNKGDTSADKLVPQSITVSLNAEVNNQKITDLKALSLIAGKTIIDITLTADNKWQDSTTWTDLAKYQTINGTKYEIQYSVKETTTLTNGWTNTSTTEKDGTWVITNTFTDSTSVSALKKWEDNGNQDGLRPTSVIFTLYRPKLAENGTIVTDPSAAVIENGEIVVNNMVYQPYAAEGDASKSSTGGSTAAQWTKVAWNNLPPKWGYVEGTDKNLADKKIPYIVRETKVTYADGDEDLAVGYDAPVYEVSEGNPYEFTIINKHTPKTKEIQVTKKWEDNDDQDRVRPSSIEVTVKATVNNQDVTANIEELDTEEENTKTITPVDPTITSANPGWPQAKWTTAEWTKLPVNYQGSEITYTITEAAVQGYVTDIPALTEKSEGVWTVEITNTHTPGETSFTATKTWNDDSDRDGLRPTQVAFQLYQSVTISGDTVEKKVEKDGAGKSGLVILSSQNIDSSNLNNWTVTWTKLPVKQDGHEIKYFVKEMNLTDPTKEAVSEDVSGYEISSSAEDVITNTWKPTLVSESVTKIWDDSNNVEKLRPQEITMTLKAAIELPVGKKEVAVQYYDKTTNTFKEDASKTTAVLQADADGKWQPHTWSELPKNYSYGGKSYPIIYSVEETAVEHYLPAVYTSADNGNFVVTNTYKPETKEIKATKIWDDNRDSDGVRPDSIQLQLKADGENYYVTYEKKLTEGKWDGISWEEVQHTIPVTTVKPEAASDPDGDDIWQASWKDLPVYRLDAEGKKQKIEYTLEELPIDGTDYETPSIQISKVDQNLFEVTNHRETTKISKQLVKYWRDENVETTRPETVDFGLYMKVYTGDTNADGTLKYTDLLRVDDKSFAALDTEKTLLPQLEETIKNAVKTVKIPAKGVSDMVTCTWANLPKHFKGEAVYYEIKEEKIPDGYQSYAEDTEDHTSIFNVTTSVEVSKVDLSNEKEIKDAQLRIIDPALAETAEGYVVESWKSDGTKHIVKNLQAGKEYTLQETKAPEGYLKADDITFTVNKDGTVTKVVMKDAPTEVKISKKTLTGSSELPGAELQILDSTGNTAVTVYNEKAEWTSTAQQKELKGLKPGTYTLHEKSSPKGYRLAKDITFELQASGKILVQGKETAVLEMRDAPTVVKILKTDENGKGLKGATLAIKDSKGSEITRWISDGTAHTLEAELTVGEEYTLTEISAPGGYSLAADIKFKAEDKDVTELSMMDHPADGSGKITVTKRVTYLNDEFVERELTAKDATFYVNLFTDAQGKNPYRNAAPKALHLVNASTAAVTFENLPDGTYYVFETEADGTAVPMNVKQQHGTNTYICTLENNTTNHIVMDLEAGAKEGVVNLKNMYYELPEGYFYKGKISINKKVLKGTAETKVDDTFYAGIFTKDADGAYNLFTVAQLIQNDTVTVEVPLGGENGDEPITYYILETDEQGDIVDLDVFEYEVSGEGTVSLNKENLNGQINIVNRIPESQEGKLKIQKVDGGGIGLAGASFKLTNASGTVVEEWTSGASAQEIVLKPGKYTLTELKAPQGYTGAGSLAITIADDYTITVNGSVEFSYSGNVLKYVNRAVAVTPTPAPSGGSGGGGGGGGSYTTGGGGTVNTLSGKVAVKTGDDTPIGLYIILIILAAALAGVVIYRKKKR